MSSFYRLSLRSSWSLLLLFFVASSVYGQDTTNISITGRNMPISGFIRQLESKTGFSFIYGKAAFDDQERVSLTLLNVGLSEALAALFKGKNLSWQYREKTVILSRQAPQNSRVTADSAPQYSVAGTVVDPQGNPVEGASVALRGQSRGQGTNSKGEFSFSGIPENAVLVVSSIGYAAKQLRLSGQREVRVSLDTLVHEIEGVEVVSTGYQDIPKERATGSFAQINNELLNRSVSTNVLDRLHYVTSGLNFEVRNNTNVNKSGINIRGISTINSDMKPLIVVDGFPYDEGESTLVINNINPNDIESVTVLKDAAAASIWGVRAGNGVIVINTKNGKFSQKANIQFNSNVTVGEKLRIFDVPIIAPADAIEIERNLYESGYYNSLLTGTSAIRTRPVVSQVVEILAKKKAGIVSEAEAEALIKQLSQYDVRYDTQKHLLQPSINQQYALNFSGGSSTHNYYASVGYDKNRATNIGNDYNRLTVRVDNTFRPVGNLEIHGFVTITNSHTYDNSVGALLPIGDGKVAPYTRLADDFGNSLAIPKDLRQAYKDTVNYPALLDWNYRPLDELKNNNNHTRQFDSRLGVTLKYTVLKGFDVEVKYQFRNSEATKKNLFNQNTYYSRNLINQFMDGTPSNVIYPIPLGGILDQDDTKLKYWNFRGQLNFSHKWSHHNLIALAGMEARESNSDYSLSRRYGYDELTQQSVLMSYTTRYVTRPIGNSSVVENRQNLGGNINRYLSYYANAAYTFQDKYNVTASGRIDGSNFYGVNANQRIVPLWSAGVGWDISNESFYEVAPIPYLKIRATYGYNGNTDNSAAAYPTVSYGNNILINTLAATLVSPPNPELRWEKIQVINLGVDFSTISNRISGSFEYYWKKGVDLISDINIDPTTGMSQFTGNNAIIKGNGFDLILNTKKTKGMFEWRSNFLLSYNTDKVTSFEIEPTVSDYLLETTPVIGKPLYKLYGYRWAGLDPTTGAPRAFISDTIANYNNVISDRRISDMDYGGPTLPRFFGSIRNTFYWNRFSLSVNVNFKFGYFFRRTSINYLNLFNQWGGHADYYQRWQKSGDEVITNIPSLPTGVTATASRDGVYTFSDILIEKADHVRLQDMRFSFDLNQSNTPRLPFKSIQLYLYATNIGIIWRANKYRIDPDYTGILSIPPSRTIAAGLTTNF